MLLFYGSVCVCCVCAFVCARVCFRRQLEPKGGILMKKCKLWRLFVLLCWCCCCCLNIYCAADVYDRNNNSQTFAGVEGQATDKRCCMQQRRGRLAHSVLGSNSRSLTHGMIACLLACSFCLSDERLRVSNTHTRQHDVPIELF